jgi:homoaconitase/3-isopropylmalate dehydratase large subunit
MKEKISFETSKLEMEKRLVEINFLIEETKTCMIEIITNYQKSDGGINSDMLQESFEVKEMILDSLFQKKAHIEGKLMLEMSKDMMKSNNKPKILKLTPQPLKIEKIYFGILIIVCIAAILTLSFG